MRKALILRITLGLFISANALAQDQTTEQKLSVDDRMARARAAKAQKRANPNDAKGSLSQNQAGIKATPADYKAPIDKAQKGPNGEVVYTGERGGKYYINRNGNKTYLSSNQ